MSVTPESETAKAGKHLGAKAETATANNHSGSSLHKGQNAATNDKEWDFSDVNGKKLQRKIDLRIIPWLSFLYLLSFLDRSAIGNARLFGLEESLGLVGNQYNIAVTVFCK